MVQTLECAHCRAGLPDSTRRISAQCLRCGECQQLLVAALAEMPAYSSDLRCGDDDDGGGGASSGFGGDSGADEKDDDKESDEDEGEEEEDDGSGKKREKKKAARAGCGFMSYGIAALILLSCCGCTIVGYMTGLIKPGAPPSIAGTWEAKDKDADLVLVLSEGGAGTYSKGGDKAINLKWKTTEPRNVELELADATAKLWTTESKSRFTYDLFANTLKLTPDAPGSSLTFAKSAAGDVTKGSAAKKDKK